MVESFILASAGMASFGSISLVILFLLTGKDWFNGFGYAVGYTFSYALIGISMIFLGFVGTASTTQAETSIFFPILYIVFGLVLLFLALRGFHRQKGRPENQQLSRLFNSLHNVNPYKAFGFGALISVVNFKNLFLFLSAVSVVHLSKADLYHKILDVLLVTIIFCFSVIFPVLIAFLFPEKSTKILQKLKVSIEAHRHVLGIWMPFIFGIILVFMGAFSLYRK